MLERFIPVLALPLLLAACGDTSGAEAFREGLPDSDTARMELPESGGQALTADSQGQALTAETQTQALEGEVAGYFHVTRAVTVGVNGSVAFVLKMLEEIVENPPTTFDGTVAVWGPHTPWLGRNTWKLTVTDVGDGTYEYVLEGKQKQDGDDAYVVVLSGTHTKAAAPVVDGRKYGEGSFLIDWAARAQLHDHNVRDTGTLAVDYSRLSPTDPVTIDVTFAGATDANSGRQVDGEYHFTRTPEVGGEFSFVLDNDVTNDGALETLAIRSRWLPTGAGRADVKASGGELVRPETISECWDENFASTYMSVTFTAHQDFNYGVEATACAFDTAVFAEITVE